MKNTIRCCISCILPCGALDVIRIVHSNGRVEEFTRTIRAADVMKAHPKHILKKPTTRPSSEPDDPIHHDRPTIVVVPPDAELQRGKIYFLIPVVGPMKSSSPSISSSSESTARRKRKEEQVKVTATAKQRISGSGTGGNKTKSVRANMVVSDQYLSEILSEKIISTQRERARGRVGVWRPHLESISETLSEAASSDH